MQVEVVYGDVGSRGYWLNVDPHDTVRKLNLLIQDTDGIGLPTYCQQLKLGGNTIGAARSPGFGESFPPEDERTLARYGIVDRSTIRLSCTCGCIFFEIFVEAVDGRMMDIISLRVAPSDTVYSIKRLIHEKTDIPVRRQLLSFEGNLLNNRSKVLDCKLKSRSTLELHVADED